jgi:hypothetical protein
MPVGNEDQVYQGKGKYIIVAWSARSVLESASQAIEICSLIETLLFHVLLSIASPRNTDISISFRRQAKAGKLISS